MNGNPFLISTPDYGSQLAGLGRAIGQYRQQSEAQRQKEEAKAEIEQATKDFQAAYANNDYDAIANLSIKYPQMGQAVSQAIGARDSRQRENIINTGFQLVTQPERFNEIIDENPVFAEQLGGAEQLKADYASDPEGTLDVAERYLAYTGGQRYLDYKKAVSAPKADLTASQKDYQLAKQEGFEGSFVDFKNAISGGGKDDLERQKLSVQIMDIQSRIQDREAEKQKTAKVAEKKTKSLVSNIDNVLGEISQAKSLAGKSFTTGFFGSIGSNIPGSDAYDLEQKLLTIQSNLGFDKLQQMREASPTGGALGSVAVQELNSLQAVLGSLNQSQTEKQLVENLEKIERHYKNWKGTLLGDIPAGETEQVQSNTVNWEDL